MDKSLDKSASKQVTGLPATRIRTIMRSLPNIENLQPASVYIVTKATEMFIQYIAKEAYVEAQSKGSKHVEYKHLASFINEKDHMEFLKQMIPKKMKVSDVKKLLAESSSSSGSSEDDSDDEDESESDSSSVIAISD